MRYTLNRPPVSPWQAVGYSNDALARLCGATQNILEQDSRAEVKTDQLKYFSRITRRSISSVIGSLWKLR